MKDLTGFGVLKVSWLVHWVITLPLASTNYFLLLHESLYPINREKILQFILQSSPPEEFYCQLAIFLQQWSTFRTLVQDSFPTISRYDVVQDILTVFRQTFRMDYQGWIDIKLAIQGLDIFENTGRWGVDWGIENAKHFFTSGIREIFIFLYPQAQWFPILWNSHFDEDLYDGSDHISKTLQQSHKSCK